MPRRLKIGDQIHESQYGSDIESAIEIIKTDGNTGRAFGRYIGGLDPISNELIVFKRTYDKVVNRIDNQGFIYKRIDEALRTRLARQEARRKVETFQFSRCSDEQIAAICEILADVRNI